MPKAKKTVAARRPTAAKKTAAAKKPAKTAKMVQKKDPVKVRIFEDPKNSGEYLVHPTYLVVEKGDEIEFKSVGVKSEIEFPYIHIGGKKKHSINKNGKIKPMVLSSAQSNSVKNYDIFCTDAKRNNVKARGNSSPIIIID